MAAPSFSSSSSSSEAPFHGGGAISGGGGGGAPIAAPAAMASEGIMSSGTKDVITEQLELKVTREVRCNVAAA